MFLLLEQKRKSFDFSYLCIKLAQKICWILSKTPRVRLKEGMENFSLQRIYFWGVGGEGKEDEGWEGVSSTTENTFWLFTHSCLSDAPNASCHKYSVSPGNTTSWGLRSEPHSSPQMPSVTPYNLSPRLSWFISSPVSGHQGLLNIRTFRGFNLSGVKNLLENPVKGSMPRVCTCISIPP